MIIVQFRIPENKNKNNEKHTYTPEEEEKTPKKKILFYFKFLNFTDGKPAFILFTESGYCFKPSTKATPRVHRMSRFCSVPEYNVLCADCRTILYEIDLIHYKCISFHENAILLIET